MYIEGLTDVGSVRTNNEDTIFVRNGSLGPFQNMFIVADGMGGHNAGEIASWQSVVVFRDAIYDNKIAQLIQPVDYLDFLVTTVQETNGKVYEKSKEKKEYAGMGTTFTACTIQSDKMYAVHVGDSRIYAIKNGEIKQLTKDHTYVAQMMKLGKLTAQEAENHPRRNMLTNVMGTEPRIEVDTVLYDTTGCSAILLCSDGLTNMLSDNEILDIVLRDGGYVEDRVQWLIDAANQRGGKDNISAILIELGR